MSRQLPFNLHKGKRGGRRPYAGRPRLHSPGVSHSNREKITSRTPLHINFKVKLSIKNKDALKILKRSIQNARARGLKIIHYSLQHNHVHLMVEAQDNKTLSRGMRSLTITFAKGIKRGSIQLERYHLHVLKTLKETQNALRYLLLNEIKHSGQNVLKVDCYSSLFLKGYEVSKNLIKKECLTLLWNPGEAFALSAPNSWLLNKAEKEYLTVSNI